MKGVNGIRKLESIVRKFESKGRNEMNQSAKIRKLANEGRSNSEISKKLGIRYQTVWRTLNRKFQNEIPQKVLEEKGIRNKEIPIIP